MRVSGTSDWGKVLGLVEQTLLDHAAISTTTEDVAQVELRRAAIRDELSASACLKLDRKLSDDAFWAIVALKPFYAGTVSVNVDSRAEHMMNYLHDWRKLIAAEWSPAKRVAGGGTQFEAFLLDKECYTNRPRLTRTINAAIGLHKIKEHFPDRTFMEHFLRIGGEGDTPTSQKKLYANFRQHLSLSEVATYHLMMELGFPIIKPDRVANRVAMRLGLIRWHDQNGQPLSPRSGSHILDTLGSNPDFAWEFQSVVQGIAASSGISVKKIDNLLVKLGQDADADKGIYAQTICSSEKPKCELCLATKYCGFP